MQASLRALAANDIDDAANYYRDEAGTQVVLEFIDALEAAINHLRLHPRTGSLRFAFDIGIPELRSWPLGKFPVPRLLTYSTTTKSTPGASSTPNSALCARSTLVEPGVAEGRVNLYQTRGLGSKVDDHVDVVGRPDIGGLAFDLVQVHHLPTDQQPVVPERWSEFDKRLPGVGLPAHQRRQHDNRLVSHTHLRIVPVSTTKPDGDSRDAV